MQKQDSPGPRPGAGVGSGARPARLGRRVVNDADVGAVKGVPELRVVQAPNGQPQVLARVELHDADIRAAVLVHVHVVRLHDLAEVVLQGKEGQVWVSRLGLRLGGYLKKNGGLFRRNWDAVLRGAVMRGEGSGRI